MRIEKVAGWAERLRAGTIELFDLKAFEKVPIDELCEQVCDAYPVRFLERRRDGKQEVGLAQSQSSNKRWSTQLLHQCLLLTSESGLMTAMSVMTELRFKKSSKLEGAIELTSGPGFSVYHDPDGWRIKLLKERTTSLKHASLKERGWLLNGKGAGPRRSSA